MDVGKTFLAAILVFSQIVLSGPIDDLQPGQWYEVPNSHLSDVAFEWPSGTVYSENGIGVRAVMDLWSGGAFDTKRDRLYVTGGGHNGYGGNELYAFDVNTLSWERLNNPYLDWRRDSCYMIYPDSTPASGHTYGSCVYLASKDYFVRFSIGYKNFYDCPSASRKAAGFDPAALAWHRLTDPIVGGYQASAYDPVTGHAFVKGCASNYFIGEYSPESDTWVQRSNAFNRYVYYTTMEVDPVRRLILGFGEGTQWMLDISGSGVGQKTDISTSGNQTIVNAPSPGLAYDPVLGRMVGWHGGANLYSLDWDTKTWITHTPAPSNTVTPTAPNSNNTYGRFRYVPSKNVYIVVNDVAENVFIGRLTGGTGVAANVGAGKGNISIEASPNPFKRSVKISWQYTAGRKKKAEILIYDCRGQIVKKIHAANSLLPAQVIWDASYLPGGIYIVKLTAGSTQLTKQIYLVK
jgi:hypothetical protein